MSLSATFIWYQIGYLGLKPFQKNSLSTPQYKNIAMAQINAATEEYMFLLKRNSVEKNMHNRIIVITESVMTNKFNVLKLREVIK